MKARLGLLLVMIPAVLTSGCVRYDRGMPIFVDSSTLSIQTVQYGTMPPPAHTAGIDLHLPDHRAPIQVLAGGKIENTLYIERGNFHTENAEAHAFRLDVKKNSVGEYLPLRTKRTATQITIHFGAIKGDFIEIKSGLQEGDQVIVSDMSRYENQEQIHLE